MRSWFRRMAGGNNIRHRGIKAIRLKREGRKLDILRKNSRVCFELDILDGLVTGEAACQWGMAYRSVIGAGQGRIIEEQGEKRQALAILMKQYANTEFAFPGAAVDSVTVIRVDITFISGKQRILL